MNDPNRPVTGYPAPNQNGHPAPPPPSYASGPQPAYFNTQQQQPYYGNQNYYPPDPYAVQRAAVLRRILSIIIGAIVVTGAIFFIIWLILRPSIPEFRVDSFTVSKLNVSSSPSSSFSGDFDVRLTVRNPNKKLSVSYDQIQALILYRDYQISQNILPPFTQPTKNETAIQALFSSLDTYVPYEVVDAINSAKGKGTTVRFNLGMIIRIGYKSGAWRARNRRLRVLCEDLALGFAGNAANGTMSLSGGPKQCKVGF